MQVILVLICPQNAIHGKQNFFRRWMSRSSLNKWSFAKSRQDVFGVGVGLVGPDVYDPGLSAARWTTSDVVPAQHAVLIDSSRNLIRNDGLVAQTDGNGMSFYH